MWHNKDPRYTINDFMKIVIVDLALNRVSIGEVITEYGFYVMTKFEDKQYISADDEWPGSWIWTDYPHR